MATVDPHVQERQQKAPAAVPAFRRILVYVDRGKRSDTRIGLAANLAQRFAGRLAGVYALPWIAPIAYAAPEIPPAVLIEQERLAQREADEVRHRYLNRVAQYGVRGEWFCLRGAPIPALRRLARYMDLAVVAQVDPELPGDAVVVRPEEIALGSGRPVLVVPYIGAPADAGRHIVIAWNGAREAARAVADAMPLLRQAQSVWVVSIDVETGATDDSKDAARDLVDYLAGHDVKAAPENLRAEDISPGDLLLSRVADLGADMLVMGCYGHSRLREIVMGGVTRDILDHMTVPVLMSH